MDVLPVELLALIFSFACTDDGYTGTSLSATSTSIRALSQPYALQSIALHGPRQIVTFAAFLQDRTAAQSPPYLRTRCHHLYIADIKSAYLPRFFHDELLQCNRDSLCRLGLRVVPGPSPHAEHAYQILNILRPHLRTLTFLLFDELHVSPSIGTNLTFWLLEELTIFSSFLPTLADKGSPIARLRRLHIIQDAAFDYHFVSEVSTLAPGLTHLRLSELSTAVYQTGDLIHNGIASLVGASEEVGFPETLEKVVLQISNETCDVSCRPSPSEPFSAYRAAFFAAQLDAMLSTLWRYMQKDSKGRIVVLRKRTRECAEARFSSASQMDTEVEKGWEGLSAGEKGLWSMDDSEVLLTSNSC